MSIQLRSVKTVGDYGSSVEDHPYAADNDLGHASEVKDVQETRVDIPANGSGSFNTGCDVTIQLGKDNAAFESETDDAFYSISEKEPHGSKEYSPDDVKLKVSDHDIDTNWTLEEKAAPGQALTLLDDQSLSPSVTSVDQGCYARSITKMQASASGFFTNNGHYIKMGIYTFFLIGYSAYFAWSLYYEFGTESSVRLLWMTLAVIGMVIITMIRDNFGDWISEHILQPPVNFVKRHFTIFKWVFIVAAVAGIAIYIGLDVGRHSPENLISIVGYFTFILLLFLFSKNPARVNWRTVLMGQGMQFVLALLVLRTSWGYAAFKWLGDRVQEFLAYADAGAIFVFGDNFAEHFFAFSVLPVIIFFSSTISVLYYLGVMQSVISKIAWLMQVVMGTTAGESVNAAGNIFIGQTEAPLLIRPMLPDMTSSELHAVMVGGYATIAGSVMALYISYGVSANHLITASVMAAPCALAMSKLFYPETQPSKTTTSAVSKMEKSPQRNVIEAASVGASNAIAPVANIAVNLIAFISLLEFFNTVLTWMGHRAGMWPPEYPELTFELICSYLFWPFAFLMGVAQADCRKVAELIGIKTFLNELVAYEQLAVIIDNTETFDACLSANCTYTYIQDDIYLKEANVTLVGGVMEYRSITIATYALCGFANLGSLGTVMGAFSSMLPARTSEIATLAPRALIAGTVASFINACIAGLLYKDELENA